MLSRCEHSRCNTRVKREKNLFTTKLIINVTIKVNLCGRLPEKKFPSSWPPMLIQMHIILYITQRNQTIQPNQSNIMELFYKNTKTPKGRQIRTLAAGVQLSLLNCEQSFTRARACRVPCVSECRMKNQADARTCSRSNRALIDLVSLQPYEVQP